MITTEAFTHLYVDNSDWVKRRIRRRGIPHQDVDDVASTAWLYAWKYRDSYDERHHVRVFLAINTSAAVNRYWRDRYAQPELVTALEDSEFDDKDQVIGYAPQSASNPEMTVIVRDVLAKLSPRWKEALELEGCGEIAQLIRILGAPATSQLLYRARERFRYVWNHGAYQDGRRCKRAVAA